LCAVDFFTESYGSSFIVGVAFGIQKSVVAQAMQQRAAVPRKG
jgi:hypothetical protein